ncbi:hypothetical protein JMJ55_07590 [Belnapia sp. T6]|uniref:Curli production assembly/transport component CsgG n=1 Tax=Belnapia mucosa TaxID=2804532 RepID=A0ABS1V254_9PROT|nr:hypothetical protein [Belnapia mucosa]MBL6455181.1 hypothetical protein [Belnapia mucosa]
MLQTRLVQFGVLALAAMTLGGCVQQGTASGPVTGAAGGGASVGAAGNLQRCAEPLGTVAIDDGRDQSWWGPFTARTQITTIEPMVRLVVQQSNCFVITAMGNNRLEGRMRGMIGDMRNSGEFRAGSNMQRGQRVAADLFIEPAILFSNQDLGGIGGGVGGWGGMALGLAGAAMSQSATAVTLSVFDMRSGVQVAASEGSATATNFGAALAGIGVGGAGALGGYQRTPAGQATVAAFVDAYNKLVVAVRNYRAQDVRGGLGAGGGALRSR